MLISYDRIQAVGRRSMGQTKECAYVVPMVLQKPTAIFEGLTSDEDEDKRGYGWRCYCGTPDHAYDPHGNQIFPYPNQVFLVFVNEDRVAYTWRWELGDPDNPGLPQTVLDNGKPRFREKLL